MRRRWTALTMALVMVFFTGCIFEPRDPEKPGGGTPYPWVTPNAPKDVFLNLASGLAANVDSNYELSLESASFTFVPTDQDALNLGPEKFANWTKTVEVEWLRTVKTRYAGTRTIQFGDKNGSFAYENVEVGKATYEGDYVMTLNTGGGGADEVYAGIARFTIVQGSTGWVMTEWRDLQASGENPTSGYLRGTLRQ